jgi:hypothetical protein
LFYPPNGDDAYYEYSIANLRYQLDKSNKFVGMGIRELSVVEETLWCSSHFDTNSIINALKDSYNNDNTTQQNVIFLLSDNFQLGIYESGCFYFNENDKKWQSDGLGLLTNGTNFTSTHCQTNHLTNFAGGLRLVPIDINFSFRFTTQPPTNNPTMYLIIIGSICAYLLSAMGCHLWDRYDNKYKRGFKTIPTRQKYLNNYFYEVNILTGGQFDAATDSNVYIEINGDDDESDIKNLSYNDADQCRPLFRRNAMDSFIISVKKYKFVLFLLFFLFTFS